jgi:hypothetical protein
VVDEEWPLTSPAAEDGGRAAEAREKGAHGCSNRDGLFSQFGGGNGPAPGRLIPEIWSN